MDADLGPEVIYDEEKAYYDDYYDDYDEETAKYDQFWRPDRTAACGGWILFIVFFIIKINAKFYFFRRKKIE